MNHLLKKAECKKNRRFKNKKLIQYYKSNYKNICKSIDLDFLIFTEIFALEEYTKMPIIRYKQSSIITNINTREDNESLDDILEKYDVSNKK